MKNSPRTVSGPLNMARLEGNIDGIHKVIYLLMDYHLPLEEQTVCPGFRAPTLKQLLIQEFDKTKHHLDFMLETYPTTMVKQNHFYSMKYIWEIQEIAKRSFNIEKKGTKVLGSVEFPNVRLHYLDIRDEFLAPEYFDALQATIDDLIKNIANQMNNTGANEIKRNVEDTLNWVETVTHILTSDIKLIESKLPIITGSNDHLKYDRDQMFQIAVRIGNKIRTKYNHKIVKDGVSSLIKISISPTRDKIQLVSSQILEHIKLIMSHRIEPYQLDTSSDTAGYGRSDKSNVADNSKLVDLLLDFYTNIMHFGVILMDAYALRRLLDKDYITHGILYTGISHSATYIWALINLFNFKLTHISQHNAKNIVDLNKKIKKQPDSTKIYSLVYPKIVYQCSNYSDFPELFT